MSLGVVCHFFREAHTLPHFLEKAAAFFDEIVMISTPPSSAPPDDESIAIVEKFGARLEHFTIDGGFGVVRTRCIRESTCDWLCILDADESIEVTIPEMRCIGFLDYPEHRSPGLTVACEKHMVNQRQLLRETLKDSEADCCRMSRRHWFDPFGSHKQPCQSWHRKPDHQLRCVKNSQYLFYTPERKMHEHLKDSRTWSEPSWVDCPQVFIEHHHFAAKSGDPEGREFALNTYAQLDAGSTQLMWTKVGFEDQAPPL